MDARRYEVADAIDVITSGPSTRYGVFLALLFPVERANATLCSKDVQLTIVASMRNIKGQSD